MDTHDHKGGLRHGHDHLGTAGDRRVLWAIAVNMLLTAAQVVGGVVSGSLSLIADALHNFSDAISLVIAFAARRIARRPSDAVMTFGYGRAEIVAALINYTTLILIGLYLLYEAVWRFIEPQPIDGWIIVVVAAIALVVDVVTALLTHAMSRHSMNIRAAFLHNFADALGSVGVIVAGTLVLLYDWRLADPIVTVLIAAYILWHAFAEIGDAIRILMLAAPRGVDVRELVETLRGVEDVADVHHVHVWAIDEQANGLEAHLVVEEERVRDAEQIKLEVKALLSARFMIGHSTLEIEPRTAQCAGSAQVIGHEISPRRGA